MKGRIALGVTVVILLALSIAGVVFVLSTLSSSKTTTATAISRTTSATTHGSNNPENGVAVSTTASNGLELSTSINATLLKVGQRLEVSISLFNILPTVNAINTSANFPFNGVAVALWPYCYGVPARIAILQGNYSIQELPAVTNVTFNFLCMEGPPGITSAAFQPNSNQVNLTGSLNFSAGPYPMSLNFTSSGYYDLGKLSQQMPEPVIAQPSSLVSVQREMPSVITFTPGIYTIAVADEWGTYNILHFKVSQ